MNYIELQRTQSARLKKNQRCPEIVTSCT